MASDQTGVEAVHPAQVGLGRRVEDGGVQGRAGAEDHRRGSD